MHVELNRSVPSPRPEQESQFPYNPFYSSILPPRPAPPNISSRPLHHQTPHNHPSFSLATLPLISIPTPPPPPSSSPPFHFHPPPPPSLSSLYKKKKKKEKKTAPSSISLAILFSFPFLFFSFSFSFFYNAGRWGVVRG